MRDFVNEAFGKSDVGVSDVLSLLAANGFEARMRLRHSLRDSGGIYDC